MTNLTVLGIKPYSMTVRDSGEEKEGVTVFCSYDDPKIEGKGVEKFSISKEKLEGKKLKVGDKINVFYNKYQKVEAVRYMSA